MLNIHPILFSALVEALGLFALLLLAWPLRAWLARRRRLHAARDLVAAVNAAAPARKHKIAGFLGAQGLDGAALQARRVAIERAEKALYRAVLDVGLRPGAAVLEPVEAAVGALVDSCLAVRPTADPSAGAPEGGPRVAELEARNASLEAELASTRETLNGILGEYAQMYERGDGAGGDDALARRLLADAEPVDPDELDIEPNPTDDAPDRAAPEREPHVLAAHAALPAESPDPAEVPDALDEPALASS